MIVFSWFIIVVTREYSSLVFWPHEIKNNRCPAPLILSKHTHTQTNSVSQAWSFTLSCSKRVLGHTHTTKMKSIVAHTQSVEYEILKHAARLTEVSQHLHIYTSHLPLLISSSWIIHSIHPHPSVSLRSSYSFLYFPSFRGKPQA